MPLYFIAGGGSTSDLEENDPSKLSLAERVKLFNRKITEEKLPVAGGLPAQVQVPKRRPRFKTQPVTNEEVETAQRISPLVASFCRPPDVELLGAKRFEIYFTRVYAWTLIINGFNK